MHAVLWHILAYHFVICQPFCQENIDTNPGKITDFKMKHFFVVIAMLVSVTIESGSAIDCYQCSSPNSQGEMVAGCGDPFNAEASSTVTCDGRCFANSTSTGPYTMVQRGCETVASGCPPTMCQSPQAGSTYCAYCCDDAMCNSMGFQEAVAEAASDTINCYQCEAVIEEGVEPASMSCGADDFNGEHEGVQVAPCQTKCAIMKSPAGTEGPGSPAKVIRTCDPAGFCDGTPIPQGAEIDCCTGDLCNRAEPDTDSEPGGSDVEKKIQCWSCQVNATDEKSACYKGTFPDSTVEKMNCSDVAKCITYTATSSNILYRACVDSNMDNLGYCDGEVDEIEDVECCDSHLCNKASSIRSISVASMIGTLIVSAYIGLM